VNGAVLAGRLASNRMVFMAATGIELGWAMAAGLGGVIERDILFAAGRGA
jgi:hypothetical protein